MSDSVARRIAVQAAAMLVITLMLVGLGTGFLLHTQRVEALNKTLLAAAHTAASAAGDRGSKPDSHREVKIEHSRSPVDVWLVRRDDPRVPREAVAKALDTDRPVFEDVDDERFVVLPFEIKEKRHKHDDDEDDHDDHHRLAAASAPRITVRESVGPFALVYGVLSLLAAAVATLALRRVVHTAFRPLERTRREADRVMALGQGQRLTEAGPIEIRSLIVAINDLLGRLDDAYQAQSRFTAEAAHELRTPVTVMLGELDVALRGERGEQDWRGLLVSVREEVARLGQLVEGLTALARIDAGQTDRSRELMRAVEVANKALAAEAKTLKAAGCSARLVIDDDPELEAHRALLEVALANLLRNAARHAPHSEVVVRVSQHGEHVVFDVDDAGPGVPPEQREALFDRFARTGEARTRDRSGLGLGLPIAREVARRHGGDCVLDASPLGGLRARLSVRTKELTNT